ncbi:MAG: hypothetical protein AAGL98_00040 [Planctomycetota bacterium]
MMREHALAGLQTQLDAAVTNGDTAAARKVSDEIAKLSVQTAPKAPPFGDAEIRAELDKQPWFGTDPKKSAKAVEYGKMMDPRKFATAADFTKAIVAAVDADFPPPKKPGAEGDTGEGEGEGTGTGEGEGEGTGEGESGKTTQQRERASDGPSEALVRGGARAAPKSGPWTKLADAPRDVQAEIKRTADKFLPPNATKEQREAYTVRALESHYNAHQRAKGKK